MSAYATALLESPHKHVVEEALRQSAARAEAEARISALEAEREALRAECARKDEALRPFARIAEHDIGETETDTDLYRPMQPQNARAPLPTAGDFRRARAALGPWRPTHQSRERDHIKVREVGRGYGPDRLMQMVLYEGPPPGNSHVLYADIFGDRYRPLTPAEQATYVEAAMTTHPDSDRRG